MIIGENMMGRSSNYACTLKVTGQVFENQTMISINMITISTSFNVPKPVSTDLIFKFLPSQQ